MRGCRRALVYLVKILWIFPRAGAFGGGQDKELGLARVAGLLRFLTIRSEGRSFRASEEE